MSANPFVSPATRLVAVDWNTMNRPSWLIDGWSLTPPVACVPSVATLTRTTLPAVPIALRRSRTKTSERPLLSPVTRVVASEANAVHMPLPLIRGVIVSVVGVNRSATRQA